MSPASRRTLLAFVAVLVVAGVSVAGTAVAADPRVTTVESSGQAAGESLEAAIPAPPTADLRSSDAQQESPTDGSTENGTVIHVRLRSDSDARWTITQHFNVSTPEERAEFEALAERFRDGSVPQLGLSSFRTALDRVEPTVNRSMDIRDETRAASVADGTLQMSFTWTNFAREDNETRIVADGFTTERGTWLRSLGPDQRLIVELPAGSALDTPKQMTDGTMRWEGPTTFQPGYMQISYTADPPPEGIPAIVWGLALVVLFVVVVLAGGYLLRRRGSNLPIPSIATGQSGDAAGGDEATTEPAPPAGAADGEAEATANTDEDGVDLSLLSDEERVEYLIEQNGGRMKQANIVKETGWSNAKVSQLLSAMEDDDRIAKLRIGRENLISFPDEDIGDFEDR